MGATRAGPLDRVQELAHFHIPVVEPVRAPDPMKLPALLLKHDLPQPISLPCPTRRVVPGPVALDGEQESGLVVWIPHSEIDFEARRTHLRFNTMSVRLQFVRDILFERAVHRGTRQNRYVHLAGFGVLQESLQNSRPRVLGHVDSDVRVTNRREYPALALGSCE